LPLDRSGRPLLPLLTWEDTRPQRAALELRALLDEASTHRRTGTRLHTSYWPAKIRWLATAYPAIAARTAHYVSFGEYLHKRLLGRSVCSLSMASGTGLLNIHARAWDSELLTLLGISPTQLPAPGDLPESLEGLAPEFAARWPALVHVPWFPAIGDGAAANIGSNCINPTTWAVTMGTSSAIRVVVPPGQVEPEQGLWLYAVDKNRALLGGALSEGGNMLAWLKQTLQLSDLAEFDQQFASLQPTAHGLTVLPQLAGERSPGWHPHAAMTIAGLTLHTTPAEIARASLEAVIFQLSQVHDQLSHVLASQVVQPRLIVNGGALLKSALLRQILADTLNRPLELSASSEASARGAALLALETLHLLPNLAQLQPATTIIVQPDPARHQIYRKARARQQELYQKMLD
jgi:gluconokinase